MYKEEKRKKTKSNPLLKTNTTMHKLGMYYLGGNGSSNNNVGKGLGHFKHHANISCYGGNFAKVGNMNGRSSNHFKLPSLGKMYNPGYYANYKPTKYHYY